MLWIDTITDADARERSERTWGLVVTEHKGGPSGFVRGPEKENGQFWGDAIKALKDDPVERLAVAMRHLPLPGAFSEMAVARRALIRQLAKEGQPVEDELRQLHYWAALSSWSTPYSELLCEPGFNVLESTPYAKLAVLDFSYKAIGCDELLNLNKTDRKMMREAWGEAKLHTTAHALYKSAWREQEQKLAAVRKTSPDDLLNEVVALARPESPASSPISSRPERKKLSLFGRIFGG